MAPERSASATMEVRQTALASVLVIEPAVHRDGRGLFLETWRKDRYAALGLPEFVQDNVSRSSRHVLRGLHLQHPNGQGKLIQALDGEVFDVAVDVRVGSPSFGRWVGERLSGGNLRQIYLPPGFAHGFCVLTETALLAYKCTAHYDAASEITLAWDDPSVGIEWPIDDPILSPRDAGAPRLADAAARLPRFEGV
jgi:dTDP-4-dehydrorhamnose 3,5-epimerase